MLRVDSRVFGMTHRKIGESGFKLVPTESESLCQCTLGRTTPGLGAKKPVWDSKVWIDGKFFPSSRLGVKQPRKCPVSLITFGVPGLCAGSAITHTIEVFGTNKQLCFIHSCDHQDRTPIVQSRRLLTYRPQHIADSRKRHISR
jgi:hypothetical protein